MPDFLEDILRIIHEMADLEKEGLELGLPRTLADLDQASREVMQSSSRSWSGYHAFVYYRDFQPPGTGSLFPQNPRT